MHIMCQLNRLKRMCTLVMMANAALHATPSAKYGPGELLEVMLSVSKSLERDNKGLWENAVLSGAVFLLCSQPVMQLSQCHAPHLGFSLSHAMLDGQREAMSK